MFDYCPLIDESKIIKKCPFAAKRSTGTHCGIKNGSLDENNVRNMKECPLKSKKYTKKTRR
tara:strand:- start:1939 stop:2121 length:183 start_codon:yes stop_codon:yes gene_type:complete